MVAHVAEWKFNEVKQIADLITKNKVIGIVEVGGIPAPQMQQMRKSLNGVATIRSAKKLSHDIEIKAGDTPFKPGPIVGELQKAGIPAAIQEGKVIIKTDKVLVPAGEKIKPDIAQILTRLEIFPIDIGIGVNGVFEDGTVYK